VTARTQTFVDAVGFFISREISIERFGRRVWIALWKIFPSQTGLISH
jgi:hypothetical protein